MAAGQLETVRPRRRAIGTTSGESQLTFYYVLNPDGREGIDGCTRQQILDNLYATTLIRTDLDEQWVEVQAHPDFCNAALRSAPRSQEQKPHGVQVVEQYRGWEPRVPLTPVVQRLVSTLPAKYLPGLSAVVITNAGGLSRGRRRSKTKARGAVVPIVEARGLYHASTRGEQAWIELFADNIFAQEPPCAWKLGFWRDWCLLHTLCHELGHHIHATMAPEFREPEDVADRRGGTIANKQFRRLHYIASDFHWVVNPLMRFLRKRHWRSQHRQVQTGSSTSL